MVDRPHQACCSAHSPMTSDPSTAKLQLGLRAPPRLGSRRVLLDGYGVTRMVRAVLIRHVRMRLLAIVAALWVSIASARAAEDLRAQPAAPSSNGRIIVRWRTVPPAAPISGRWRHRRALANGARLIESADASQA